jgi:hypothetical protein
MITPLILGIESTRRSYGTLFIIFLWCYRQDVPTGQWEVINANNY